MTIDQSLSESWTSLPLSVRDAVLKKLISRRQKQNATKAVKLMKTDRSKPVPAALEQEFFLQRQQKSGGRLAWTMAAPPIILDHADVGRVEAAFAALARRHEVLRSTFIASGDHHVLVTRADAPLPFTVTKMPMLATITGVESWITRHYQAMLKKPFDPEHGPLWHAELVARGDQGVILMTFCSAIVDGESLYLMHNDLNALLSGKALEEPAFDYADYASTQAALVKTGHFDEALAVWCKRLAGGPPKSWADGRAAIAPSMLYEQDLGSNTGRALDAYAAAHGTTPSVVLLTEFMTLLHGLDGQNDLWVSAAVATRDIAGTESMVGTFARQALLRMEWPKNGDALTQVRDVLTETLDQQPVPHLLVRDRLERENPQAPMAYRYVFNYRQVGDGTGEAAANEDTPFRIGPKHATSEREEDVLFMILQSGAQRQLHWYLRHDRFTAKLARQLLKQFHDSLCQKLTQQHRN